MLALSSSRTDITRSTPQGPGHEDILITLCSLGKKDAEKAKHFDYPYRFEVRRVSRNSDIRWSSRWVQVSSTLAEKYIGFEEIDNVYNVYFCELLIGRFMEKTMKIEEVIERVPIRQTVVECGNPKMRRKV
ncbi:MAG: hypothetical protein A4E62_01190 [Syntrophorhabdus sp. PtaU1.Bin002]|nr:MAG: hypothetical protein A4E62_01190 [Syntrophorhabdus sp. PtaU1.Bin002]